MVIALSLTAYESCRLKTANRISHIADACADLFKAMHNLCTDRSTTTRLLNATEPMDAEIEKYLRTLRDAHAICGAGHQERLGQHHRRQSRRRRRGGCSGERQAGVGDAGDPGSSANRSAISSARSARRKAR
ncbi:hypothetical protein AYJ54_06910 [Bradyrhizobium centrolobii]|uniref:Uncharacterized protein n=1 Tax=Bradyrhizobium centrolobii TaxID=1505087 RepID=A0A176YZM5_9BRAD|nr:hypothetical protein AYJ54_06910 [Bradyrhizobium centrolobii]